MNVKRFIARTSREALNQVRMAFGADAVVLSNRPCDAGVEVLAMAPEGIAQIEQVAAAAPRRDRAGRSALHRPQHGCAQVPVEQDVQRLAMSTLSFQDYVRERLLRRRRAAMQPEAPETVMPTYEERHAPAAAAPTHAGAHHAATDAAGRRSSRSPRAARLRQRRRCSSPCPRRASRCACPRRCRRWPTPRPRSASKPP